MQYRVMQPTQRRHVTLKDPTAQFLEQYQRLHKLPHFSASVEAAVEALRRQTLSEGYTAFARDYEASAEMQREAELWLERPMEEV